MKATKQTTYSWESATNATKEEAREFANYLLGLIGEKSSKSNLKFEIAPKSTEVPLNWDDARLYCLSLNIDGKTGWRLPTKKELNLIYKSDNDLEKRIYWSSTVYNDATAYVQGFSNGKQFRNYKGNHGFYVKAIRDI